MKRAVLAISFGVLIGPGLVRAQEPDAAAAMCSAPISICSTFHVLSPDAEYPIRDVCPPGYACTCVPSCPLCADCAVQVCVPEGPTECKTACDCEPGLGCFDGRCIAGFAPVFCCDSPECPAGQFCQHLDGTHGRCPAACSEEIWLCPPDTSPGQRCGDGRVCSCTASCPACEDCGPGVCVVPGTPTPYRCDSDGGCANPGDRCVCVSSCPECDDCAMSACVPPCDEPRCEERVREITRRIENLVLRASRCDSHDECVQISTSTECRGTCGEWVNERHAARVRKQIDRLNRRICGTYLEDGCPVLTPACMHERGLCVDGRCRGVSVLPQPVPQPEDLGILEEPVENLLPLLE